MPLTVRTITPAEHQAYVATHPGVPLRQTPQWGDGFEGVRTESLGWFAGGRLVGAGLVRYRGLPRVPLRTVAVFDAGPDIDWSGRRRSALPLPEWIDPLVAHLRGEGAFSLRVNPFVAEEEWWGVDPAQRSTGKAVSLWQPPQPRPEFEQARRRLAESGWSRLDAVPAQFHAEVLTGSVPTRRRLGGLSRSGSLQTGYTVRAGSSPDLAAVHQALRSAHPGLPVPGPEEILRRWRALTAHDEGAARLLVVEQRGEVVYGGLVAVVGERAWDLSPALPQPDADRPEVQVLRTHLLAHAALTGSRSLVVPTVVVDRRAPVRPPAPGWPPARVRRLIGTWHLPVRGNWHAALAPIVDRLVL